MNIIIFGIQLLLEIHKWNHKQTEITCNSKHSQLSWLQYGQFYTFRCPKLQSRHQSCL